MKMEDRTFKKEKENYDSLICTLTKCLCEHLNAFREFNHNISDNISQNLNELADEHIPFEVYQLKKEFMKTKAKKDNKELSEVVESELKFQEYRLGKVLLYFEPESKNKEIKDNVEKRIKSIMWPVNKKFEQDAGKNTEYNILKIVYAERLCNKLKGGWSK